MIACWIAISAVACAAQESSEWIGRFLEGTRALEGGEIGVARDELERALALFPEHAPIAWQLADVAARAGDRDAAFAWLDRAAEWGGADAALLDWDPDLAPLRDDARYAPLRERMAALASTAPSAPFPARIATLGENELVGASERGDLVLARNDAGFFLTDTRAGTTIAVLGAPHEEPREGAISADGRIVAATFAPRQSFRETGILRVYDARTGDLLREIDGVPVAGHVELSRDGGRVLAAEWRYGGGVWETSSGRQIVELSRDAGARLSADGSVLVQSESSTLSFWSLDEERYLTRHYHLPRFGSGRGGMFSSDGTLAMIRSLERGGPIYVLDGHTGTLLRRFEAGDQDFAAACLRGATGELLALDERRMLRAWDARDGTLRRELSLAPYDVYGLEATADGAGLVVSTRRGGGWHVLDARSGELRWSLLTDRYVVHGMLPTPDGARIVTEGEDGAWTVREARTGVPIHPPIPTSLLTRTVARSASEELCLHASDGRIRRVDARDGRAERAWFGAGWGSHGFAVSSDGLTCVTADASRTLRVIETGSGAIAARIENAWPPSRSAWLRGFCVAPDGASVALAGLEPRVEVHALRGERRHVSFAVGTDCGVLAYRPDGERLAIAQSGGRVLLIDPRTGREIGLSVAVEGEVEALAFDPTGEHLYVGNDQRVLSVFDASSGAMVRAFELQPEMPDDGWSPATIAFSPDRARVAIAPRGLGTVSAWDVASGARLWAYWYSEANDEAMSCAYAASGERVCVWGQGRWSPRIVDAATGATLLDLGDGDFDALVPFASDDIIAAESTEGLAVVDQRTGERRWTRVEMPDEGWLLFAPTRHVDGTLAALTELHLVTAERSYPLDALAAALLDPKKVAAAAAAGVRVTPATLRPMPTLAWREPVPRVITLSPGERAPVLELDARCPDGVAGFELVRSVERITELTPSEPTAREPVVPESAAREPAAPELITRDRTRTELAGEELGATHRRLVLPVDPSTITAPTHLRLRAIGARGTLSRALHVTLLPPP